METEEVDQGAAADMACFLDFDHTLFNTDEFFHVDFRGALRHLGMDRAAWEESYRQAWQAGYALEAHAEELSRRSRGRVALDEMKRIIRDSFSDLSRYVFPDVLPFLEDARRKGVGLYLLSFGNPEWQRQKVLGAGMDGYFDRIFFTSKEGGKVEVIREQARRGRRVSMVDNNPSELDVVRDSAPYVTTYCMNRVPQDMIIPADEPSELRFFEAREYLGKTWRHRHAPCTTLSDVAVS